MEKLECFLQLYGWIRGGPVEQFMRIGDAARPEIVFTTLRSTGQFLHWVVPFCTRLCRLGLLRRGHPHPVGIE